jgi:dTDP-4-amino-4,6-dideoxygalactose transaminase
MSGAKRSGHAGLEARRPHQERRPEGGASPPPPRTHFLPFNRPFVTGREFAHIEQAIENGYLAGNGPFTRRCEEWLSRRTDAPRALLTTSGSAALELATLLLGIGPGDEVIMPSFTFVSTANAVVLRGGVPVFVDVRPDTLNLDVDLVEPGLSERTRALVPVHYAGVACDMDRVAELAREHGLEVIEDAAQGVMAAYRGRALGSIGTLGCLSFHETKNVISGEGGALLVNEHDLIDRAEVLHEKGTNRAAFFRGAVDRYTWIDVGSSFLPSDINAAFLWAQLEQADQITARRLDLWNRYHQAFAELEAAERARRPIVPDGCRHNAHMYYLLLPDRARRDALIERLAERDVMAVFHYVPLHSSPAGQRHGRTVGALEHTDAASDRLVRLPLWVGMDDADVDRVAAEVIAAA